MQELVFALALRVCPPVLLDLMGCYINYSLVSSEIEKVSEEGGSSHCLFPALFSRC